MNIESIFFELIQVAIGVRESLSCALSAKEWGRLYDMSKKQSLIGICFAGVQKLNTLNPSNISNLSELQYLTWMGMAAKIQQRNEIVNKQCTDLQKRLVNVGVRSVIMKGQGVATYYNEVLRRLRQSGDIDILLIGEFENAIKTASAIGKLGEYSYVHAEWEVFDDTEVELHYRPSSMRNLICNHRFQKWAQSFAPSTFEEHNGIITPSLEFNRIYLLLHCYRHVIGAGIGLRQLMDYYFCLRTKEMTQQDLNKTKGLLKHLGLFRFAGAVMYVLAEVFQLEERYMICKANTTEGAYLLRQILIGGNFGRYDDRAKGERSGITRKIMMNLRYAFHYPDELLWALPFRLYVMAWKKKHNISKLLA